MKLIVHTDGGARGNPGPAAIGVVIEKEKPHQELARFGRTIGESTNNVAEYTAVSEALERIKTYELRSEDKAREVEIQFYLDSKLVVNQLNGTFKVKEPNLRSLLMKIRVLEQEVGGAVQYFFVPREENRRADFLVNQALDNLLMSS